MTSGRSRKFGKR